MTNEAFTPAPLLMIEDLETLRVLADPLRSLMIEALVLEPLTVKQLAEKLGHSASKLYYHINLLEKHGLIQVVDTRVVSGIIEKFYRAAAVNFDLAPTLLTYQTTEGQRNISDVFNTLLDTTREDLMRSFQARLLAVEREGEPTDNPRRFILKRSVVRLTPQQTEDFQARFVALLEEFAALDHQSDDPNRQPYALTAVLYPTMHYTENSEAPQE